MRKAWKIGAAGVAGIVALALVLPYFIDVNQHRGSIQSELEKRLHRKVTLGAMGLRLIPLSIRAEDVTIAEAPDFASKAPFLTAKHIDVHVGLWRLLRKQVEVDSLHLRAPSVELIRNADGRWNYASLGGGSTSGGGGGLELANLEMQDGRVAVTDVQNHKARTVYDHIDVTLRDFGPGKRFALDVAVHLPGKGKQLVSLKGSGGPWRPEGLEASNFHGRIVLQEASLSAMLAFLNAGARNGLDFVASGESAISQDNGVLGAKGTLNLANLIARGADLGASARIDYETNFDRKNELLKVESLKAKLGGFALNGSGSVSLKPSPPLVDLRLNTADASLSELARLSSALGVGPGPGLHLDGRLTAQLQAKGPTDHPALTGFVQAAKLEISRKEWKQPVRTASLHMDLTPDAIRAQPLVVESGGTRVKASFSLAQYTTPDAILNAELKTEGAEVGELLRLATAYGLAAMEGITGSGQASLDVRVRGPVRRPEALECSGSGSIQNTSLNLPSFTKPLAIRTANVHFEQNGMTLENLNASLGGTTLHGNLTLHNFARPEAQFTADIDQFNVPEWRQLLRTSGPPAPQSAKAVSNPLAKVTGSGTVTIGKLLYDNLTLNKVRANCALDHGILRLEPVTAELYGGQESGSITVDLRPEQPTYAVRMKMERVDANQLLSATTSLKQLLYGLLAANADASFVAKPGEDIARTLNGKMYLTLVNGKLTGVNLLNEVAAVGRFVGYAPRSEGFTNIVQLTGNLAVRNGVATTDDLKLQFDGGALTAAGTIGLADQTLNLHLTTVLHKQVSDQAGGSQIGGFMSVALANNKGELVMPLIATGTFAKPRIAPDAEQFAKMKVQNLLPSAIGVIGGMGQGKNGGVQGVLDALQGKKAGPGDTQKNPADSLLDLFKKKK